MTPEVIHARDGLRRLAERLTELGARRILVIVPPSRRHLDRLQAALAAFQVTVFDGARVHVPAEVVELASAALGAAEADTLVSLGGGSTVGLGKALRLRHDVRFAAVPTTYAGSEVTTMYGITTGAEKKTGRDDRVRPDLVVYDASLGATLPIAMTVQSLMNGLAHVVSVLSTGSLTGDARVEGLAAAAAILRAVEDLLLAPASLEARERASRAAQAAATTFDHGKAGVQHALAHLLGGGLGVDHAPLHSILLPQTLSHLRERDPGLLAELETALGRHGLEAQLVDLLMRAGAPTSLDDLKIDAQAARALVAARPDLPASIVDDAQIGLRPAPRIDLGTTPLALLAGPPPERARRVILALHGRGAEAGGIVRRYREIVGHDPEVAVIGLRTAGNKWYGAKYSDAGAGESPEVRRALDLVAAVLGRLPRAKTVLAGFSQGSCLALEYAARSGQGLAAVIAPCGARIGAPTEWGPSLRLDGLPVLLGAGAFDPYLDSKHIDTTADWFRRAGAAVEIIAHPGDRHDIMLRQRLRARELVRGVATPPGDTGFGNTLAAEALPGALPAKQNTPRAAPYGLVAEQVNGTGFTAARAENSRTWLYRVRPSSARRAYQPLAHPTFGADFEGRPAEINLVGFAPLPPPGEPRDFVDGLVTVGGAGRAALRRGWAVHLYAANRDMERRAFYDADGDLLLIPELGALTVTTELGVLEVAPGHIAVLPRGIAFSVALHGPEARGYLGEAYGRRFRLPERGPVGANGLADARHFRAPSSWYEDKLAPDFRIAAKLDGRLHEASQDHSPFDVVAWHGNHVPFVYDLDDFSPAANVRFDHGDPSIFTVIGAPLDEPGASALDLIVFPTRWDATEGTFRPPFFHRNPVTEVNGIVREPGASGPFQPGCCFVTPCLTPHGTSAATVDRALAADDRPHRLGGASLWFQLESALPMSLTPWAEEHRLPDWPATWGGHRSRFTPG